MAANIHIRDCPYCRKGFETLASHQRFCSIQCTLLGKSKFEGECRIWLGKPGSHGYGDIVFDGVRYTTHRLSYITFVGPIPGAGTYVCHSCDNRLCIHPEHLFLGDVLINTQDCVRKGRNHRKLSEEAIRNIRAEMAMRQRGTGPRLAKEYGVSSTMIYRIAQGLAWRHVAT